MIADSEVTAARERFIQSIFMQLTNTDQGTITVQIGK